jgi:hypothetical protein
MKPMRVIAGLVVWFALFAASWALSSRRPADEPFSPAPASVLRGDLTPDAEQARENRSLDAIGATSSGDPWTAVGADGGIVTLAARCSALRAFQTPDFDRAALQAARRAIRQSVATAKTPATTPTDITLVGVRGGLALFVAADDARLKPPVPRGGLTPQATPTVTRSLAKIVDSLGPDRVEPWCWPTQR